jgi:hypothetical protein
MVFSQSLGGRRRTLFPPQREARKPVDHDRQKKGLANHGKESAIMPSRPDAALIQLESRVTARRVRILIDPSRYRGINPFRRTSDPRRLECLEITTK